MTSPLILLVHQRVLPGGQLTHRLQDHGYRVQTLADPTTLVEYSLRERPLLVIIDLAFQTDLVRQAIVELSQNPATNHIPVIAFAPAQESVLLQPEQTPGATLTVHDGALLLHLDQLLDQALQVD